MTRPTHSVEDIQRIGARALHCARVEARFHPGGFGNENWRLRDPAGRQYVLKIGDRANEAKWRSSSTAHELATAAGLAVPELVHTGTLADHLVRIFTWIDGRPATQVVTDPERQSRFLRSLGAAVGTLHGVARETFSSRLDGSAPAFAQWADYITYRLDAIRRRCEATHALDADLLDRVCDAATALAADVTGSAEAVLCHRDLHPGNLIVGDDGTLAGIIDWDGAESWDRAGDWFKLEFDVLQACPDPAEDLLHGYLDGAAVPPDWTKRRQLVHLVEALGVLPNAVIRSWSGEFVDRARTDLSRVLSDVD